jgi:hypothetical protein
LLDGGLDLRVAHPLGTLGNVLRESPSGEQDGESQRGTDGEAIETAHEKRLQMLGTLRDKVSRITKQKSSRMKCVNVVETMAFVN